VSTTPAISVVMPCYNRAHDLIRTLQAYDQQQGAQPFELIAIDDHSTDQTEEVLRTYQSHRFVLKVARQDENRGPAAARNRGLALAGAPLILFAGDDILPDPYLVEGHLAAHCCYPQDEISILGRVAWPDDLPVNTLMAHIDGIGAQQFSYYYMQNGQEYDFRHFYTANISAKRATLQSQSSWFDTQFPYAAYEDAELSFRLAQQGMRILYFSHLTGFHYHYHTIWTFAQRQFRAGQMACLLVRKHPPTRKQLMGRSWPYRLLGWDIQARLQKHPPGDLESLETRALHWASQHEWVPDPMLDTAYLAILSYYYAKGLIFGICGDTERAARITRLLAQRKLARLLFQVASA
jgi:glycosyltransferase involved in cell wall biosynthesis